MGEAAPLSLGEGTVVRICKVPNFYFAISLKISATGKQKEQISTKKVISLYKLTRLF